MATADPDKVFVFCDFFRRGRLRRRRRRSFRSILFFRERDSRYAIYVSSRCCCCCGADGWGERQRERENEEERKQRKREERKTGERKFSSFIHRFLFLLPLLLLHLLLLLSKFQYYLHPPRLLNLVQLILFKSKKNRSHQLIKRICQTNIKKIKSL